MQNFGNGQKKKLMLEVKNILDNKDSIFEKICSLLNKTSNRTDYQKEKSKISKQIIEVEK